MTTEHVQLDLTSAFADFRIRADVDAWSRPSFWLSFASTYPGFWIRFASVDTLVYVKLLAPLRLRWRWEPWSVFTGSRLSFAFIYADLRLCFAFIYADLRLCFAFIYADLRLRFAFRLRWRWEPRSVFTGSRLSFAFWFARNLRWVPRSMYPRLSFAFLFANVGPSYISC